MNQISEEYKIHIIKLCLVFRAYHPSPTYGEFAKPALEEGKDKNLLNIDTRRTKSPYLVPNRP